MVLTPHRPRSGLLLFATKVFQYIRSQRSQSLSRAATTRAMLFQTLHFTRNTMVTGPVEARAEMCKLGSWAHANVANSKD